MATLKCPISWCGATFGTIAALETHLRVDHGVPNPRHHAHHAHHEESS